ncbi:MAG: hypothetical protein LBE18_03940 [Planctomycetaceae bacterium]|jgi:hypothetical protein|nr:hypothetical protein [Planctomycetaceae bacterium]
MKKFNTIKWFSLGIILTMSILVSTGCTVNHHGMTLPNGSYLKDSVEYYPHGPRYQFSNEAAHLQETQTTQENIKR